MKEARNIFRSKRRQINNLINYWTLKKLSNILLVEYEYYRGKISLKGKPYIYVIEPTNICNLRCIYCPTGKDMLLAPKGKINLDDFRKVIDTIKDYAVEIMLYNWGEPFLHPEITELISYAHRSRIGTVVSSNMMYSQNGISDQIIKSGLDHLIMSFSGITGKTHEIYHVGSDFNRMIRNVEELIKTKQRLNEKKPHIEFKFLPFKHNQHEIKDVEAFAKKLGCDSFRIAKAYVDESDFQNVTDIEGYRLDGFVNNRNESHSETNAYIPLTSESTPDRREKRNRKSCFWPWRAMVINWNLDVDLCCAYYKPVGNILSDGLENTWNNSKYQNARLDITGHEVKNEDILCLTCRGYDY
jgi:MoaA/NifB/PqqE/SkfB family radical SAM enzyme